jgi:CDP-glycerol glycerophosphotransferase
MDVPRLARIAGAHPDDAYRRALGAFARDLSGRDGVSAIPLADDARDALAAALLW